MTNMKLVCFMALSVAIALAAQIDDFVSVFQHEYPHHLPREFLLYMALTVAERVKPEPSERSR